MMKKGVKVFCGTTQFPSFLFCDPHAKFHVVRGLKKYYHMLLYPKLGHVTCKILQKPVHVYVR